MTYKTCALCGAGPASVESTGSDCFQINCPACGIFQITGSAYAQWQSMINELSPRQVANVRGWMRENQASIIDSSDLVRMTQLQTPSVGDRAEKLLKAISGANSSIGAEVPLIGQGPISQTWQAVSWSENDWELTYLVRDYLMRSKGWLQEISRLGSLGVCISPAGHDYLDQLRRDNHESNLGFCAMWFAPEVASTWRFAIEPAIRDAGYEPVRIDGVEHNNRIDDEILATIRRSRFVVADFTGERGGVYFEAGFALGLGRQVVWTVREDALENIHFDNRQYNFLIWSPDNLEDFRKRLHYRIEATIGKGPYAC